MSATRSHNRDSFREQKKRGRACCGAPPPVCGACAAASAFRVPAPPLLCDLAFCLKSGQHAVEIVLLDSHLRRQLGNRDPGLALDERQCLSGARPAAFATACATAGARGPGAFGPAGFFARFGGRCTGCGFGFGFDASARPGRTSRTATARGCGGGGACACRAHFGERSGGGFQSRVLLHCGLELPQPVGYLSALLVKEVVHDPSSSLVSL
jgi:hypothetical protein